VAVLAIALACRGASAEDFDGWNLEPGVQKAQLIMVARVTRISRVTVVEGAKTDVALREFRFQPIRVLKGIFQRDELSMTASDLGLADASASPLKEGELRLLILVQQSEPNPFGGPQAFGCVAPVRGSTEFHERVPLLAEPDDALVSVVETLIKVADSRSRRERAKLVIDRLADANGVAVVPLLTSLKERADWAAADARAWTLLASLAQHENFAVRRAALELLRDMLANRSRRDDPQQLDGAADALRQVLESKESVTRVRVAALEALGELLAQKNDFDWSRDLLIKHLKSAPTNAERVAALTALASVKHPDAATAVLEALAELPLDELRDRRWLYLSAALRLGEAERLEEALLSRLERSMAAHQSIDAEVKALGVIRSEKSLPLLLSAAGRANASSEERQQIAWAFARLDDDRAAAVLASWLKSEYSKEPALAALETIDSPAAAEAVRPLLRLEPSLAYKLRMARLLARYGFADGYSLAIEHLADANHTAQAALVLAALAALDDPRAAKDLGPILANPPDRRWHAAALTGLTAIGDATARKPLLEILANDRHPLADDAATAAGLAADSELLIPVAKLVESRDREVAVAALLALRRWLLGARAAPRGLEVIDPDAAYRSNWNPRLSLNVDIDDAAPTPIADIPAETRAAIAEAVAALAADAYVEPALRHDALGVSRLLGGEEYDQLLTTLADQADLETVDLLSEIQNQRRQQQ
jgi:hypothetical protein